MKKSSLIGAVVLCLMFIIPNQSVFAEDTKDKKQLTEEEIEQIVEEAIEELKELFTEESLYGEYFKPVEIVGPATIRLQSDSEELEESYLKDFANLQVKNNLKELWNPKFEPEIMDDGTWNAKFMNVVVEIMTVGDDYPVAHYTRIRFNTPDKGDVWEGAYLGYCNEEVLLDQIKSIIAQQIEAGAIVFFKSRGEL